MKDFRDAVIGMIVSAILIFIAFTWLNSWGQEFMQRHPPAEPKKDAKQAAVPPSPSAANKWLKN